MRKSIIALTLCAWLPAHAWFFFILPGTGNNKPTEPPNTAAGESFECVPQGSRPGDRHIIGGRTIIVQRIYHVNQMCGSTGQGQSGAVQAVVIGA